MKFEKIERYLAAQRDDGKFLFLECNPGTTTPHFVDNPIDATRVGLFGDMKPP